MIALTVILAWAAGTLQPVPVLAMPLQPAPVPPARAAPKAATYSACAALPANKAPKAGSPLLGEVFLKGSPLRQRSSFRLLHSKLGFTDCIEGFAMDKATPVEHQASLRSLPGFALAVARMRLADARLTYRTTGFHNGRHFETWSAEPSLRYAVMTQRLSPDELYSSDKGAICLLEINVPEDPAWDPLISAMLTGCALSIAEGARTAELNVLSKAVMSCLQTPGGKRRPDTCHQSVERMNVVMRGYDDFRPDTWPGKTRF